MLLIDIGNSRIKWGVQDDSGLDIGSPFDTDPINVENSMNENWSGLINPKRVVVSNVGARTVADRIQHWILEKWDIPVELVESQAQGFGVHNGYSDPTKLGVDRWVGLIALRHCYDLPACLIDCGTAITLDLLGEQGAHGGGLIIPGVSLMRDSLSRGTYRIAVAGSESAECLADNTDFAIGNGTLFAAAGFVELVLRRLQSDNGAPLTVIFTGGGHPKRIASKISFPSIYDPDLILKGLSIIAG